jgi:hypothetical protein
VTAEESSWRQGPDEEVGTQLTEVRRIRPRDLLVRFAFGAATSAFAGALTIAFKPRVGGVFLAFPAILAATLTLIAEEEDKARAREDARGAVVGAVALALFAAIGVVGFERIAPPLVLAAAGAAWALGAVGLYLLLWRRR